MILVTFISCTSCYGQDSDTLKCNGSIVLQAYKNVDGISDELLLNFLKTFGKDCKSNVEFSEFCNETLFKVIQQNPVLFSEILEKNFNQIEFDDIIFNLENPLHDLIDLDLTIVKIADTKIDHSIKDKLILAIHSGDREESTNVEKLKGETVIFFLPDSLQFNSIINSDKTEGIYEFSNDFEFYAGKIIDLYKDSTLNVSYSDKRFFIVNNELIDKMRLESPFGCLLVKDDKFKIETGVFTDWGFQQLINDFYNKKE